MWLLFPPLFSRNCDSAELTRTSTRTFVLTRCITSTCWQRWQSFSGDTVFYYKMPLILQTLILIVPFARFTFFSRALFRISPFGWLQTHPRTVNAITLCNWLTHWLSESSFTETDYIRQWIWVRYDTSLWVRKYFGFTTAKTILVSSAKLQKTCHFWTLFITFQLFNNFDNKHTRSHKLKVPESGQVV